MKLAAILTAVVGTLVAFLLLLLPTSVQILGTSIDCGPPIVGVFAGPSTDDDTLTQGIARKCVEQSTVRDIIGLLFLALVVAAAAGMWVYAQKLADADRAAKVHGS